MGVEKRKSAFEKLKALVNSNAENGAEVVIHYSSEISSKSMSNTGISLLMSNT